MPSLRRVGVVASIALLAMAVAVPAWLAASNHDDDVARLKSAAEVFRSVMAIPDKGIPEEILRGAECLAVIPGVKTGAFVVGADYGKGVVTCKNGRQWGPPLFITLGGGSYGFQIGVQSADVVMVFGNRSQLNSLLSSKFRIGAEASAAAGPVGRNAEAGTDVKLNSQILTYGRSKGLFAGISISGAVMQPDTTGNEAMYGEAVSTSMILEGRRVVTPPDALPLINELNRNTATNPNIIHH